MQRFRQIDLFQSSPTHPFSGNASHPSPSTFLPASQQSTVKVLKVKKNTRDGGPEAKSDGAEAVSQATTFRPHASRGDPEVGTNSRKVHPHPDHLEVTDIESEQETVLSWVRNIFDALDADGSGDLRIEELRTAKCHLLPWFGPDSEMGRLLDRLERNPNDSIIWEQFAAAIDFPDQIMTNTHVPTLRHNSSKVFSRVVGIGIH